MRRRERGVTLMELLIAVTLVSLLSVGMLMAIRVGLSAMERSNDRFLSNRRAVGAQRILQQQVANLMPAWALCRPSPEAAGQRLPFFQGEPQSMRFVSTYSIAEAARGTAKLLEYQVIPGENGQGVRLVVNEFPYATPMLLGQTCLGLAPDPAAGVTTIRFAPITVGPGSFVLADKLAACRFRYQEPLPPPRVEQWHDRWPKPGLPRAIRIDMAPLSPDPARLQWGSVTLPLRLERSTEIEYVD